MTVTIRQATRGDKTAIVSLSAQTLAAHRERLPEHFASDRIVADAFLTGLLRRKFKGGAFVAVDGTEVVGWAGYQRYDLPASEKQHEVLGLIIDVTVEEEFQGQGIGSRLVEALVDHASSAGITKLHADVWNGAPSAGVLTRMGIVPVKTVHELRLAAPRKGAPRHQRLSQITNVVVGIALLLCIATILSIMLR